MYKNNSVVHKNNFTGLFHAEIKSLIVLKINPSLLEMPLRSTLYLYSVLLFFLVVQDDKIINFLIGGIISYQMNDIL